MCTTSELKVSLIAKNILTNQSNWTFSFTLNSSKTLRFEKKIKLIGHLLRSVQSKYNDIRKMTSKWKPRAKKIDDISNTDLQWHSAHDICCNFNSLFICDVIMKQPDRQKLKVLLTPYGIFKYCKSEMLRVILFCKCRPFGDNQVSVN